MMYKKHHRLYEEEILKQSDPYSYYVQFVEGSNQDNNLENSDTKDNKGVHIDGPFICIEEKDTHRVYDAIDYYIYESVNGKSSEQEKSILIENAYMLNADLIYSDTDYVTSDGKRHTPFFKPDWSPDLFEGFPYFNDFFALRKRLVDVNIFEYSNIAHLPKVLFHIESDESSEEIYRKIEGEYRSPDYDGERNKDDESVSVIIPSKDNPDMLIKCVKSLENAKIKSGFNEKSYLEVIIVDNGSSDENKEKIQDAIKSNDNLLVEYIYEPMEFNFSEMCNIGAEKSTGNYLLFLNDDIEVSDEQFLVNMVHYARKEHVGAVGIKLLYPGGDLIQHTGITDLMKCGPSHKLMRHSDSDVQYFGINKMNRNSLAVTGACLMLSSEKYFIINGFHDKMKVGYNDVDLCISLAERGFYNVLVNDSFLYHHESVSRGSDILNEKKYLRLSEERKLFYELHPYLRSSVDPFYNENLADDSLDYVVNVFGDGVRRDYRSQENISYDSFIKKHIGKPSKLGFMNIESVGVCRQIFEEGNALEISGWGLLNKRDNALYDRYLVIFMNDSFKVFSVAPVYRNDVAGVFEKADNTLISGFIAKIPVDENDLETINDKEYEYGMLFVSKATGIKYYAEYRKSDI